MDQLLEKSFDFSIRAIELIRYLNEEKKLFPLSEHFLRCATAMGVSVRLAHMTGQYSLAENNQTLYYVVEVEYLLEIMSKTGYLQEKQTRPMMDDCRELKHAIAEFMTRIR